MNIQDAIFVCGESLRAKLLHIAAEDDELDIMSNECIKDCSIQQFGGVCGFQAKMVGRYAVLFCECCCSRLTIVADQNACLCIQFACLDCFVNGLHATSTVRCQES